MNAPIFETEFDEEGFNAFFGTFSPETSEAATDDLSLSEVMAWEAMEEGDEADNYPLSLLN